MDNWLKMMWLARIKKHELIQCKKKNNWKLFELLVFAKVNIFGVFYSPSLSLSLFLLWKVIEKSFE